MMLQAQRSPRRGFTRSPRGSRRGPRRELRWDLNIFAPTVVDPNTVTEFVLLTQANLQDYSLARGTIVAIYGRMVVRVNSNAGDAASGAWGICLKEADSSSTQTGFSPALDGDSSIWITTRAYSLFGSSDAAAPTNWQEDVFSIRNPRKVDQSDELVMNVHNLSTAAVPVQVQFWCRVGILLP